jgi:uncharacterized ferritin-like protein (DUF455 family)
MRRFIEHHELARDSRFVRQDNAQANVLSQMPDDVDTIVNVFEQFTPMIEESVRGTAAQALFDDYGPGFALTVLNEPLDPDSPASLTRLLLRMHGIFAGELQALEGAARSLWDFPDSPWEFKMNMARQCWDEARHIQIFEKLLTHLGGEVGMFPESTFLFEACCSDDPAMRVAGVNRGLEGLACDVFRDMIRYAEKTNDETMRQAVDYVLADEITHVRFGSEWVKEFTKGDPEHFKRTQEYRREVDKRFSFGGARSDRDDAAIPIAWEDRKEAGFTEEELQDLVALSGSGPSKKTLIQAAKILRERHLAGRAASEQEVAS